MKSLSKKLTFTVSTVLLLASLHLRAADDENAVAAESPTEATPSVVEFHPVRSLFVDEIGRGIDPFFPRSERRRQVIVEPVVTTTSKTPNSRIVSQLELKGISGTRSRRIALINRKTFEQGEVGEIILDKETARIRCEQITDTSVTITLLSNRSRHVLELLDE